MSLWDRLNLFEKILLLGLVLFAAVLISGGLTLGILIIANQWAAVGPLVMKLVVAALFALVWLLIDRIYGALKRKADAEARKGQ